MRNGAFARSGVRHDMGMTWRSYKRECCWAGLVDLNHGPLPYQITAPIAYYQHMPRSDEVPSVLG